MRQRVRQSGLCGWRAQGDLPALRRLLGRPSTMRRLHGVGAWRAGSRRWSQGRKGG